MSLKLGLIDASISNSTDAFVGVHDTGGLGGLAGDLLLVPRSSTGVDNSIRLFSGQTTPKLRQNIDSNGDISFYEDTGTTPKFFWDASAESLGIGTSSPSAPLSVMANTSASVPAAGADSSHLAVGKNDQYGTMIGSLGSGDGYIQQQRFDGNTATYNLLVQPNGGNVGIGTSSIDGNSNLQIQDDSGNALLRLRSGTSSLSGVDFGDSGDIDIGGIRYSNSSNAMQFNVNAAERLRISSSGRVGIGTSLPSAKATIEDGDFARLDLNLSNATGTTIADVRGLVQGTEKWRIGKTGSSSDDFAINVTGSERMRIDSSGRVGIGTSSPQALVDVTSAIGSTRMTGHQIFLTRNGNNEIYAQGAASVLALGTNSAERMRIDSSGNVGIGTSSPNLNGLW